MDSLSFLSISHSAQWYLKELEPLAAFWSVLASSSLSTMHFQNLKQSVDHL